MKSINVFSSLISPLRFVRRGSDILIWAMFILSWALIVAATLLGNEHSHHHHHHVEQGHSSILNNLLSWLLMVYAMMLPMSVGALRWLQDATPIYLRFRVSVAFVIGYSMVWLLVGVGVLVVGDYIMPISAQLPLGAIIFLLSGIWVNTPSRRKSVIACGAGIPIRIDPLGAIVDATRFGSKKGWICALSCLPVMFALHISGHSNLLMAIVTALLFYERTRLPQESKVIAYACYILGGWYGYVWYAFA